MRWIIKIENNANQRILVRFDPKAEQVVFIGQYKPNNAIWTDFSEESIAMNTNLEIIQNTLTSVYDVMKKRFEAYENINQGFSVLKIIEIQDS